MCMLSAFISIRERAISKDCSSSCGSAPLKRNSCVASQQQEGSSEPISMLFNSRFLSLDAKAPIPSHPIPRAQQQWKRWDSTCWESKVCQSSQRTGTCQHCLTSPALHVRLHFRNDSALLSHRCGRYKKANKISGTIFMCRTHFIFYSSSYLAAIFLFMEFSIFWITQTFCRLSHTSYFLPISFFQFSL